MNGVLGGNSRGANGPNCAGGGGWWWVGVQRYYNETLSSFFQAIFKLFLLPGALFLSLGLWLAAPALAGVGASAHYVHWRKTTMQDPQRNLSLATAIAVKMQALATTWLTMMVTRGINARKFQAISSKFQGSFQALADVLLLGSVH